MRAGLIGLACAVLLAGCGKEGNALRMVTEASYPPYEFLRGREVVGVDVEVCRAIAEKVGKPLKVVNVDFDGKQPADPEPVTYAGTAKFPATGTKWNSLRGTEDEKPLIEKFRLRTANGTPTDVSVKLEASSGNLMFDNFGSAGSNNLLGDYLYVPLQTQVTLTIAGLVPDACYDLYLFTSVANSYSAAETMANFGGVEQTYQSAGPRVFVPGFSDHFVFRKVKADAFGRIVGGLSGSGTHSGVFNGFQLIGDMPERHSGLCVILR